MMRVLLAGSITHAFLMLAPAYALEADNCEIDKISAPEVLAAIKAKGCKLC